MPPEKKVAGSPALAQPAQIPLALQMGARDGGRPPENQREGSTVGCSAGREGPELHPSKFWGTSLGLGAARTWAF